MKAHTPRGAGTVAWRRGTRALGLLVPLLAAAPLTAAEHDPVERATLGRAGESRTAETDRLLVLLRPDAGARAQHAPDAPAGAGAATPHAAADVGAGAGAGAGAPSLTADRARAVAERQGVRTRAGRALGERLQLVQLESPRGGAELREVIARLREHPEVLAVEPDGRRYRHALPNDPLFAGSTGQWYLQAPLDGPNGRVAAAVNAEAAWTSTTGSRGVVVAVLDTGVRFDHPDLRRAAAGGRLLPGYDFVGADRAGGFRVANDGDGWDADPSDPGDWVNEADREQAVFANCRVGDSSWHGTRVAGMIGALTDNGTGVAGLDWGAWLLPVRVLGKCFGYDSDILAGMRWAAGLPVAGAPPNPYPARVLNLSLGGDGACNASYQATIDEITARGVAVVVSAGNDGSTVDQPANCRGVIAVTGVRHAGTKVGFSNLGPRVAIAAPGGNCVNVSPGQPCLYSLRTTTNLGRSTPGADDYTDQFRFNVGTSFAAPIVSGIAGLMLATNGNLSPAQLRARLGEGAAPFPFVANDDQGQPLPTCRVPTGENDTQLSECNCTTATCGAGLANARGALDAALRPIAAVQRPAVVAPGQNVVLNAAGSGAACGRSLAQWEWSVVANGGGSPGFAGATNEPRATVVAPATGSLTVRVRVTDDLGRSDVADVVLTPTAASSDAPAQAGATPCLAALVVAGQDPGGGSPAPPPPPAPPAPPAPVPADPPAASGSRGGGGALQPGAVLALAAFGAAVRRRRAAGAVLRSPR